MPANDDPVAALEPLPPQTTVARYFYARFGRTITDARGLTSQQDFTIATECGRSCAQAIDAAATLLAHLQAAHGPRRWRERDAIVAVAEDVVRTYVYG